MNKKLNFAYPSFEKYLPLKKQFILKCENHSIISGFLDGKTSLIQDDIHIYYEITSGYCNEFKIKRLSIYYLLYSGWYAWYFGDICCSNIVETTILPSRQEIQSELIYNSCLSQNLIHKIVQVYL